MSADLIARLRHFSKLLGGKDLPEIMSEAADSLASKDTALAEIRAENERLQKLVNAFKNDGLVQAAIARQGFLQEERDDAVERAETAESELARVKKALEPFATYANLPSFERLPADMQLTPGSGMAARQVTVGDFRAAADVLSASRAISQDGEERE